MEGGAAAAVEVLVQNLIDLCKKEISQIRGLDKDAAKLTKSLKTIQKFLNDAETRDITSEAVKEWLKNLEDVAFDADNVLDELNYHILSDQIKPAEPEEEKIPSCFSRLSCFSCCKNLSRSRNMALTIKEINENLESINKEISQIRGFRKNAEKLAGSLDMIQKFLHNAEMRAITSDAAVKSWLKKLEDVAFDADNVLDEINYHILSKQIKATKPMKAKCWWQTKLIKWETSLLLLLFCFFFC